DVVIGLPKLKFVKDQLCSSCELIKAKRSSLMSKVVLSSKGRLNLLHMDLVVQCGLPASIGRNTFCKFRAFFLPISCVFVRLHILQLNAPLFWPTVEEDGVTRLKKYSELSAAEAIQANCEVKETNIILQGLPSKVYPLLLPQGILQPTTRSEPRLTLGNKLLSTMEGSLSNQYMGEVNNQDNRTNHLIHQEMQNSNLPALQDDLILYVIEQLKTQVVNFTKINHDNKQVNELLTVELESVIEKSDAIVVNDSEETLLLAEESRLKMIEKQKDPKMAEKKVITKPIDYAVLNQLSKDFETRFVPQTELSAEQAFWSRYSVQPEEPNLSASTTVVEVPKELPKVSLVNSSLKKLKFHLASFDMVVKERTTATA
nr:retrovirus-related Pol polyprotein from transposon TNT 1-94 [Tanacetum cinerariifolium]